MFKFVCLQCCNCNSVILNLPETEVKKLYGLTFRCECCNHLNTLNGQKFVEGVAGKKLAHILSYGI